MTENVRRDKAATVGRSAGEAGGRAAQTAADQTAGQLMGEVTANLSTLMRQELALAKAEIKREVLKSGRAWGMLGGAGFAGYMVLLFASIAVWWGLAEVMAPGWAALIVTAVWAVIGAVLYTQGRRRMREVDLKPERTAETVSEMPEILKGALRR